MSLPVQLARAQAEALRTVGDPEGRFRAKWQLVRSLYRAGYNADDVRELFRLIDWMMHLRDDLEQQSRVELAEFEEQMKMPYVTASPVRTTGSSWNSPSSSHGLRRPRGRP